MTLSIADVRLCLLWGHYDFSWAALAERLNESSLVDSIKTTALAARLNDAGLAGAGLVGTHSARALVGVRALRRVCRNATMREREDAVRWLVELAPRPAPLVPEVDVSAVRTSALIARLRVSFPAMPRIEMEELIRRGRASLPELLAIVRQARLRSRGRTLLWAVVVIGEIRDAAAVEPLVRLLAHRSSEIAAASAEALGKIGLGALATLRRTVTAGKRTAGAVYAYGALAMIRSDDAYALLVERLTRTPEDGDLVAGALALQRRPEAVVRLRAQRRRAPLWMRGAFTDAIAALAGTRSADGFVSDWRLRYRRLPSLGWGVPPSWIQIAAMVRERRRGGGGRHAAPRLAAQRYLDVRDRRCRRCSGVVWQPLGLPLCAHTASAVIELQAAIIRKWCEENTRDVWTALDVCDAADLGRAARPVGTTLGTPAMDVVAVARATLYWLAGSRLEHMPAAARHIGLVSRDIHMLYDRHHDAAETTHREREDESFRRTSLPSASHPQIFS